MAFIYCGIDLAVRRKSAVAKIEDNKRDEVIIHTNFLNTNEEIVQYCKGSKVIAIDSPLSLSQGYRNVDKEMIRKGYRVLPPSFMKSLVLRALALISYFPNSKVIETHPTSSLKKLGINWRTFSNVKDEVDAVVCVLVAYSYDLGIAEKISSNDGEIYLLPKNIKLEKMSSFYIAKIL